MQAEFSENNVINWLRFFCNFINKEDQQTIRKYIMSQSIINKSYTSRKIYRKYWGNVNKY